MYLDMDASEPAHDVIAVHVTGEIDMLTAPVLRSGLAFLIDSAPAVLVIDLTGVRFIGASGFAALVGTRDEAATTELRLVCDSHAVLRPLEILGLDAVTALRRGGRSRAAAPWP
jgi:anti-sigma B factor antagonist